ncbi:MAG: ribonuclease HII [Armatimonadetes bacterium]|nr:MAG: ribonuclease HII [Armatimonadota bacterium]
MKSQLPTLIYEKSLWEKGYLVIGIDEVGRGPLAGPLLLAGVVFNPAVNKKEIAILESLGINDSKKLTAKKRKKLDKIIKNQALTTAFATASPIKIDKLGLTKCTEIAVRKIVSSIMYKVSCTKNNNPKILNTKYLIPNTKYFVLIDAFSIKYIKGIGLKNQKGIIRGDQKCFSIAAASVIAKVKRDSLMEKTSTQFPEYNFAQNKGYGTKAHIQALQQHGPCPLHRKTFLDKSNKKT